MQTPIPSPQIAIVAPNTLVCIGLAAIIERMMPRACVRTFATYADLREAEQVPDTLFYHYFVASQVFLQNALFFLERRHRTIVLVHGDEAGVLPTGMHTLNLCLPETALVRAFLRLAQRAHGENPQAQPEAVRQAWAPAASTPLTPREVEVLCLIVKGCINKEIAATLGVTTATVISHRKNLIEKLGIKSVSGLTIYAVTHGLVRAEEI